MLRRPVSFRGRLTLAAASGGIALLVMVGTVLAAIPAADDRTVDTPPDTAVTISLGGTHPSGSLTYDVTALPAHGLLDSTSGSMTCVSTVCSADVLYTPDTGYVGADGFSYTVTDATDGASLPANVSITVGNAPVAVDDPDPSCTSGTSGSRYVVLEDQALTVADGAPCDLLANDTDADADSLAASHLTDGTRGTVSVAADGGFTYTPNANQGGVNDSFDYTVSDGSLTDVGTVSVSITAVNDVPSFVAGANQSGAEDSGAHSVPAWATSISAGPSESGQTLSFQVASNTNTALFAAGPAVSSTGTLTWTPASNRNGTATVGFRIHDSGGTANGGVDTSATQTVTFTISAVDDPPNAVNDTTLSVKENAGPTALAVLANDTILPDAGETITIVSVTQGSHGAVAITGGGTGLTYDPTQLYSGSDQFSYTIRDSGGLATDTATVAITVLKDTTPPTVTAPVQTLRTGLTMGTSLAVHIAWSGADTGGVGISRYEVQVQVDGGSYGAVTLATATSTSVDRLLVVGHTFRYRVRAVDRNGNTSFYSVGPTFTSSRYQEDSGQFVYSGTWLRGGFNASYSGGYTRYTSVAGRSVTFSLTFFDAALVVPKSIDRGSLQVYVDNVLVATISEKTTTTLYRQVVWARHYATSTRHVIRIAAVGGARIDIDCMIALR